MTCQSINISIILFVLLYSLLCALPAAQTQPVTHKNSTLKYEDLAKAIKSGRGVSYDTTLVGEMAKLRDYRNYEITVVPVIIGCCGEVGTQLWSDLGRLPIEITDSMIERLSRSAVCGTNRVILAHTSKE